MKRCRLEIVSTSRHSSLMLDKVGVRLTAWDGQRQANDEKSVLTTGNTHERAEGI